MRAGGFYLHEHSNNSVCIYERRAMPIVNNQVFTSHAGSGLPLREDLGFENKKKIKVT